MEVSVHPYGDHNTADSGAEVHWDTDTSNGFIDVPNGGEPRFPHGDGFAFFMAGNESRVEADDGTVLWHCKSLQAGDPT